MNKTYQHHNIKDLPTTKSFRYQATMRRQAMYSLLTTLCVILCTTTAFPRSSSSTSTSTSRMTRDQLSICEWLEFFMWEMDLCRDTFCRYYPEARCRMVPVRFGCRTAWYTSYGEVDCNVPRPPRRRLSPFQIYLQEQLRRTTARGALSVNPTPIVPGPVLLDQSPVNPRQISVDPNPISTDPNQALTACPNGALRVECLHNPCLDAPDMPGTTCTPNYCGGCMADIYRNGMKEYCADCEFPHLIIKSSVVKDPSAYVNTFQNVPEAPPTPTNTGPWTEAGPRIHISEMYVQDVSPTSKPSGFTNSASTVLDLQSNIGSVSHITQPQIPNAGGSAGSSILALQGNIGSVSHLPSPSGGVSSLSALPSNSPIDSHLSNPMTAANDLSKTTSTISGRRYLVSMKPAFVVDPSAVCPNGKPKAKCYSDPCFGRTCDNFPLAICRSNPCGNCEAMWFVNETKVDCERCDRNAYVTTCPKHPCELYTCPAHPHAECRMSKCGSCKDLWYDEGIPVSCDIDGPVCTEKEKQACKKTCPRYHCPTDYEALCRVKGCGASCKLEYYKVVGEYFEPVRCKLLGW